MPRGRSIQLMEWFKDLLDAIWMHPNTRIGARDEHQIITLLIAGDHHGSTRLCELDPVIEELAHHPANFFCICLHSRNIISRARKDLYAAIFGFAGRRL